MFNIRIADFVICIDNKYDFVEKLCKNYITDDENADLKVSCTDAEITSEKEICSLELGEERDLGYVESICIYRHICLFLPQNNAFVLHGAVIEKDDFAYAFLARSGTGKSTHIKLWAQAFPGEVKIVNGDKPIIRKIDGAYYAYGTPWCGKEGWNRNVRSRLRAICFLERGEVNTIEPIAKKLSALRIMKQILIPKDELSALRTFELMDDFLKNVDTWLLHCDISTEAAIVSHDAMTRRE